MNLSQDEIDAMMIQNVSMNNSEDDPGGMDTENINAGTDTVLSGDINSNYTLTEYEEDTLGEVGNMCMGAVATTMYTLLDRRVSITTPRVSIHTAKDVLAEYSIPFVLVEVKYTEGIEGKNLLLLKEPDAALITDLLMGGDGVLEVPTVLNEMHMSAISEVMNQMIGSAATTLSKLLHIQVNISPPKSDRVEIAADLTELVDFSQIVVKISFDMVIEGLLESQLIQILPYGFARDLAKKLMDAYGQEDNVEEYISNQNTMSDVSEETGPVSQMFSSGAASQNPPAKSYVPQAQQPSAAAYSNHRNEATAQNHGNLVDVRPMQFDAFDVEKPVQPINKDLDMIYDIPLQVSVQLGKTKKDISEILEFGMGTVIVLEKIAGDPVEILANGKLIARGEVVVIDENYGVRITELLNK